MNAFVVKDGPRYRLSVNVKTPKGWRRKSLVSLGTDPECRTVKGALAYWSRLHDAAQAECKQARDADPYEYKTRRAWKRAAARSKRARDRWKKILDARATLVPDAPKAHQALRATARRPPPLPGWVGADVGHPNARGVAALETVPALQVEIDKLHSTEKAFRNERLCLLREVSWNPREIEELDAEIRRIKELRRRLSTLMRERCLAPNRRIYGFDRFLPFKID